MPKADSAPCIAVSHVSVELGGRRVITDASVEIGRGEFIGLLGPNGAGKTTLMRSIMGLIPYEGNITVNSRLGYVPQRHDVAWDFPINVFDAVANGRRSRSGWWGRLKKADRVAVTRALELVGLSHLAKRPIGELSGGQRQRVLIARALAPQPEVLLMDEPFTGLDYPTMDVLLELFDRLTAGGVTVVMSTHNLTEAVHSCRRLILFHKGIVADGPAATLARTPDPWMDTFGVDHNSPLMRSLLAEVPAC